jgi:CheY-like chemotaxis protein/two-component sensor histidine kinase
VAHEINNPLAVIMANLDFVMEILGQGAPDAATAKTIDAPLRDAREAVDRIRAIVRDVALFSRPQDEERGAVDVKTVIESSIRMAWNEIRHRAHVVKAYGNVPMADSNEARLGQILLNLLVNAAQAMPVGRASENEIRVATTKAENGRVVIEVSDTGVGIPARNLGRIFDPFFTTKAVGVGSGLGLALCHRMITDLGGDIAVESEVGKGTSFRITLPTTSAEPRRMSGPLPVEAPPQKSRVLVIDDEMAICRALSRNLGRHHEVVALTSGKEALARIAAGERFDAIVSDLMMPEVTGAEIYEELSRTAPDQAKRMIFLTGGAFTDSSRTFLDRVSNPCIQKPFEVANILKVIARIPRR